MNAEKKSVVILITFSAMIAILSQNNAFFGDMVQFGSRHSHFFYENNFSSFWLPNLLDSGHPPVFGMYIAICWKIFGKSLVVSHWAMFPFLLLIAFAIPRLLKKYVSESNLILTSIIVFIEPTLLAQSSLTSPDIVLVSFFLWAFIFYTEEKYILLSLALIPMSFISLRGMMMLFSFFIAILFHQKKVEKKYILTFAPAVSICFYWLFRHYQLFHWIGFHSDSPWASSFQSVGIAQMIKNFMLMIWRWIDFGRVSFWIILCVLFIFHLREKTILTKTQKFPLSLLFSSAIVFTINTIFADGLIGHRYYMPIYFIALIMSIQLIELYTNRKQLMYVIILASFFIGANYTYPNKIAMGWDATPAHRPYYKLRLKAIDYLEKNNIPLSSVGAGFPSLDSREYLELNGDTSAFQSYANPNNRYILWSNVFNYPDYLQDSINKIEPIYSDENNGIFMKIIPLKK